MAITRADRFRSFCGSTEPRLRRALVAAYGPQLGSEACAEALSWAWEHFDRIEAMVNPAGYLWRVGQSSVRRELRQRRQVGLELPAPMAGEYEPGLVVALAQLSGRQRAAVLLVHGYGCSLTEAAEQLDCRVRTLRNHLERGMAKLRGAIGGIDV